MKAWLRRILAERPYRALARFKNKSIPDFRYRLGQSPFLLLSTMVKLFPDSSQVTLKSGINVVRKMDYRQRDIFLAMDSDFEYRVRLHSCEKEPETVDWIETFMKEGDVLYDVGANVGAYSLVASKFFYGKVKVYAFEPAFPNFAQLCKNLALNGCQGAVVPLQVALSDQTAIGDFNYRSLVTGTAVHALGEPVYPWGGYFNPVYVQPVLTYRMDDLIAEFQIPIPNHIKIDVDGIEFAILEGMKQTLLREPVRTLMVEINEAESSGKDIVEFLEALGFRLQSNYGLNHLFIRGIGS